MSEADRLAGVTELSAWIAARSDDPGEAPGPLERDARQGTAGRRQRRAVTETDPAVGAAPIDEESARSIALRALGRKAASRQELDRTLERRDVEPEVRAAVLDRLVDEGYVDDGQLARDLAERLRERKQLGERGIAAELRRRGLDPDELDAPDRDEELERAVAAASDRRRRMRGLDDETVERRLAGWLQRRGFSGGTVRVAMDRTRPRGPRFQ